MNVNIVESHTSSVSVECIEFEHGLGLSALSFALKTFRSFDTRCRLPKMMSYRTLQSDSGMGKPGIARLYLKTSWLGSSFPVLLGGNKMQLQ